MGLLLAAAPSGQRENIAPDDAPFTAAPPHVCTQQDMIASSFGGRAHPECWRDRSI